MSKEKRDELAVKADAWRDGYSRAMAICQAESDTRTEEAFANGRRFQRERYHKVEWRRLTIIAIAGGFIGSVLALMLAAGVITTIYYLTI
jgi:type IV secretory pathway component VirB8